MQSSNENELGWLRHNYRLDASSVNIASSEYLLFPRKFLWVLELSVCGVHRARFGLGNELNINNSIGSRDIEIFRVPPSTFWK
jgi:hypothetical protein